MKNLMKGADFQAEYEGSIPFTRSSLFKDLARESDFILTNGLLHTFCCTLSDRLFGVSLDTLSYSALDRPRCELIGTEYLGLEKRHRTRVGKSATMA